MNIAEFNSLRGIVEDKYDLWLGSVDALAEARQNVTATTKDVQRAVGVERHDWSIFRDATSLLRNAALASTVPLPVKETVTP